ncbi:MAG: TIGR04086 family membrane protein [Bacilli bacterium]|jgi:putative membrane protein (TIGR04086 family)|nr:TIGR04086 family membrane protein [Bacilli bacterium]
MLKVINYLKYIGMFIIFIVVIALATSLINLTGINSNITNKVSVILTALSFFIVSALASKSSNEKGYILGIKLGLIFVILMTLVNLLFFKSSFNIDRIIYYSILIISSILGGSFGKNLKIKKLAR